MQTFWWWSFCTSNTDCESFSKLKGATKLYFMHYHHRHNFVHNRFIYTSLHFLLILLKIYYFIFLYVIKCSVILFLFNKIYLKTKNKKNVLENTWFQRGFEFFKNIKKKVKHQKLKVVEKMQQVWYTSSSFWNFILKLFGIILFWNLHCTLIMEIKKMDFF